MSKDDNQDKLLEEYLSGQSDVSSKYHSMPVVETPELLKRRTIAAVEKLMDADHQVSPASNRTNWYVPVSIAAVMVLSVSLVLNMPGDNFSDLEEYTDEVLNRPGDGVESLPEIQPYEGYTYESGDNAERDPFQSLDEQSERTEDAYAGLAAGFDRELSNRSREELESYELDSLKMIGTMEDADETWALIRVPDGSVIRVKAGNYLGRNTGQIINIHADRIEIREIIRNSAGQYEEREVLMVLQEE